jgi:hypothetical protein
MARVKARALLIFLLSAAAPAARSEPVEESVAASTRSAPAARTSVKALLEAAAYADTDHVSVLTPTLAASISDPVAGWSVGGSYLLDAVSAASADIVSSASARWKEVRHVGAGNIHYKPHDFGVDLGGGISREPDYLALAAGGTLSADLFDKNLTVTVGYSHGDETAGRSGTPFSVFSHRLLKDGPRVGLTIIADPTTVVDFTGEADFERGDQSKPYRYVPLFAPGVGARIQPGASADEVNAARLGAKPAEQLPLERQRFSVTSRLSHRFPSGALRLEERLYSDDWGLQATTTDARYIVDATRRVFLWPHLRAHFQSPVTFWKRTYDADVAPSGAIVNLPGIRTGDRELGPLRSFTVGGGLRLKLDNDVHTRWTLTIQGDAVFTSYLDALYIKSRTAFFGALGIETELD